MHTPFYRSGPFNILKTAVKNADSAAREMRNSYARSMSEGRGFSPKVDIYELKNSIVFEFEVPGIPKEDIKLKFNNENILTISGEKKFEKEDEVDTCCRKERKFGEFSRSFKLPENIDSDKINARYDNGILRLTVARLVPENKEKEVQIG
ncbi:MAG: Hsp20/alpha crystallin family protein [Bacteroidota bacterium]